MQGRGAYVVDASVNQAGFPAVQISPQKFPPPLTCRVCPVMNAPPGPPTNKAASAISHGLPARRMGVDCGYFARACSVYVAQPSETIGPGAIQFTRIPNGAHSTATASLNATTPARAAQVCATW